MNLKLPFSRGGRSATWYAWVLWLGIYQCESQIAIFWWVDVPLDLPPGLFELSDIWIHHYESANCHLLGGGGSATWSVTWPVWDLRVGIYEYESQIAIYQWWGRSATWSANWSAWGSQSRNLSVWIWNCHFLAGVDLELDLPEFSG